MIQNSEMAVKKMLYHCFFSPPFYYHDFCR